MKMKPRELRVRVGLVPLVRFVLDAEQHTWPEEWRSVRAGFQPALDDIAAEMDEFTRRLEELGLPGPANAEDLRHGHGWPIRCSLDPEPERIVDFCQWVDRSRILVFHGGGWLGGVQITGAVSEAVRRAGLRSDAGPRSRSPNAPPPRPRGPVFHEDEVRFMVEMSLFWPLSEAELKAAFKRFALKAHPDHNPGDPHAAHKFHVLNRGYQRLRGRFQA